ncbi:MAG: DUF4166 domain-containing protein [Chlorobia bacterium]|nr:DUF4166 domain-containing protein [Fimbriimonadaceae bacterium]
MAPENPYQTLIGAAWEGLPAGLRLSHQVPLRAIGNLNVFRATRGLAGIMSRLLLLPPAGENVRVSLVIEQTDHGIQWNRTFGKEKVDTRHTFQRGFFFEHMGPFALQFRLEVLQDSILIQQLGITAFGLPLPRWIGPRVTGKVTPGLDEARWHIDVQIRHDWFGDVCRYHGIMRAE